VSGAEVIRQAGRPAIQRRGIRRCGGAASGCRFFALQRNQVPAWVLFLVKTRHFSGD
jgi:hypothetical protein